MYQQADSGLGMTPSSYRAGGHGEHIDYAVRSTRFGRLLMAATARGVCCVQFGDDADGLVAGLHKTFPKACLRPAGAEAETALAAWMLALEDHLSRGGPVADLPLDLRGTAFQIRVWRFLLSVKPGEVVTYSAIAAGIGAPGAVRATGSACGANRLAVLVPCHRAMRADGGLGGYRWGVERKRDLLEWEREGCG
jgi:AraC family transcriptional regulator of adaptative response/methylated-DNA-[protein]-cysteine methyltransferase